MSIGSISYAGYTNYTAKSKAAQASSNISKTATESFSETITKASSAIKESAVDAYKRKHPEDSAVVDGYVRSGEKVLEKNGVENISREDMTMEEYKAFFTTLMDSIPFDASHRGDVEIWSISEKGWEQMKNDPKYEAWVLGYTVKNRSVYNPFASWPGYVPNVCTEKFGDSIEQHIGQTVPMNSGSGKTNDSDEESWWEKRQKKIKELLEQQEETARKRRVAEQKIQQEQIWQTQTANAARLRLFLTDGISSDETAAFSSGHVAIATGAYENVMSLFSNVAVGGNL